MFELLLGAFLSWVTSWVGEYFPNTNNLVVLAVLACVSAIIGASGYYFLTGMGYFDTVAQMFWQSYAWAIAIYQILVNLEKEEIVK